MVVYEQQFKQISKIKIYQKIEEIIDFFNQQVQKEVIYFNQNHIRLKDYIRIKIDEAFDLDILTEQGVVKYIFALCFNSTYLKDFEEFNLLKKNLLREPFQQEKIKLLDDFIYEKREL